MVVSAMLVVVGQLSLRPALRKWFPALGKQRRWPYLYAMLSRFALLPVLVLGALVLCGAVAAQDGKPDEFRRLGTFNDWEAYAYREDGKPVCYMVSQPKKKQGDYTRRGDVFAMVTHRPGENSSNVVSFYAGYTYKEDSSVRVQIGSDSVDLFTAAAAAWTRSRDDDRALIRQMIRGADMVVKGTSRFDTETTDTYSLTGFTAAYRAISRTCDVKPIA